MMILAIVSLAFGFVFAMCFGMALGEKKDPSVLAFLAPIGLIVIGANSMYDAGIGKPTDQKLENNAVYERLSSAMDNGKYVVVLRTQDGDVVVHLLDKNPPPASNYFKYTGNTDNPYQSLLLVPASK